MPRILAIGIATLDIVNLVPEYPTEDSEIRALGQRVSRGGNATNTLAVLSQLGHRCSWGGVLAADADSAPILADLHAHDIDLRYCRRLPDGKNPVSYILLSQATGSRSIVHYRDLPEFGYADFVDIDLDGFDWLHFEGRNVDATLRMLEHTRKLRPDLPISLEVEKPRLGIERLFGLADLLLFSRAYAIALGHVDAAGLLQDVRAQAPRADLICSWGKVGAQALDRAGNVHASAAFPPLRVIDTLGAGDTFNAGIIDARLRGCALDRALTAACRLAGRKCGLVGLTGVGNG
jgi:ketohexokinase